MQESSAKEGSSEQDSNEQASTLPGGEDAPRGWGIQAVDDSGQPIVGANVQLVDVLPGALNRRSVADVRTTGDAGRVTGSGEGPFVTDVDAAGDTWFTSFIHAAEVEDKEGTPDLLGHLARRYDLESPSACVFERGGAIELTVLGAGPADVHTACFVDERPEPGSHRTGMALVRFTGPTGTIAAPPGRGILYLTRDGALGGPISGINSPLIVSVASGATSRVRARFEDGPTTTLIAPFDNIPFELIEILAPDATTVVGSFPFETSPLRIPSVRPVAVMPGSDAQARVAPRTPRHLARANAIAGSSTGAGALGSTETPSAPPSLLMSIDVGLKLRLPESDTEWIQQAQAGAMLARGSAATGGRDPLRSAAGTAHIDPAAGPGEANWTATVELRHADGSPAPWREVLIGGRGLLPVRAISGADGKIALEVTAEIPLGLANARCISDRIDVPAGAQDRPLVLTLTDQVRRVEGRWLTGGETPVFPAVLVLVPEEANEIQSRSIFGTRAFSVTATDSDGRFVIEDVPPGRYRIRSDRSEQTILEVSGADAASPFTVELEGRGQDFTAAAKR